MPVSAQSRRGRRTPIRRAAASARSLAITFGWAVVLAAVLAGAVTFVGLATLRLSGQQVRIVSSGSMTPVFRAGDAVLVHKPKPGEIRPGQIVSFHPHGRTTLVTHRVVALHELSGTVYVQTKGDANPTADPDFTPVQDVVAIYSTRIPNLGRWLALYGNPRVRLLLLGVPLTVLLASQLLSHRRRRLRRTSSSEARARHRGRPIHGHNVVRVGSICLVALAAIGLVQLRASGAVYTWAATAQGNGFSTRAFTLDTFGTSLSGWTFWTDSPGASYTYALTRDTSAGNPAASAKVAGEYNPCYVNPCAPQGRFGMTKIYTITPGQATRLAFDVRATSGYASSGVTNAALVVQNGANGTVVLSQSLVSGGTTDSGWLHFSVPLSGTQLAGINKLQVIVSLADGWTTNWSQTVAVDNVGLS